MSSSNPPKQALQPTFQTFELTKPDVEIGRWCPIKGLPSRHERERPYRAAGTAGELQRRHHEQRTGRRQRSEVRELRNAILSRTEEVVVERERRIKASRRASVDADGLHTNADDRALLGEPAGALGVEGQGWSRC